MCFWRNVLTNRCMNASGTPHKKCSITLLYNRFLMRFFFLTRFWELWNSSSCSMANHRLTLAALTVSTERNDAKVCFKSRLTENTNPLVDVTVVPFYDRLKGRKYLYHAWLYSSSDQLWAFNQPVMTQTLSTCAPEHTVFLLSSLLSPRWNKDFWSLFILHTDTYWIQGWLFVRKYTNICRFLNLNVYLICYCV